MCPGNTHSPPSRCVHRLFVLIRETFERALKVPEHPDFINAESLTDYTPEILDPDTALHRLESDPFLSKEYPTSLDKIDLEQRTKYGVEITASDDRYIEMLHPAERELAFQMELKASAYLLIKRNFFAAYYTDIQRTNKEPDQRVRTEYASQQWLEREHGWVYRKAKRLVVGWRLLGLLDESRVMPWISEGGILEVSMQKREDGDDEWTVGSDGGGSGDKAGKVVAAAAQSEK